MSYFILLLPVLLPALFWAAYHLHADRHLPEPLSHIIFAFALGTGSFYLGLIMYRGLDIVSLRYDAYALAESNSLGLFAYSILVIGVVEELAKMIPFLLVVLRFREFNEPIDGIIYASFIALGFAAVENIYYLQFLSHTEAYARGFVGPVLHIVFASIWGYYIGKAWLCKRKFVSTIILALMVTAIFHGIYDFVVIGLPASMLPVAAILIAGLWIWRLLLIRDLHSRYLGSDIWGQSKNT